MAKLFDRPMFTEGPGFLAGALPFELHGEGGGFPFPSRPPAPYQPPPSTTGGGPGSWTTGGPLPFNFGGPPPMPSSPLDTTGLVGAGQQQCDRIPNPLLREACRLAAGAVGGYFGNQGGGGSGLTADCPPGYNRQADGSCRVASPGGGRLPGDIGMQDVGWTPVNGRYGAGATPIKVQSERRVCPLRHVLGDDGICYRRLPRSFRAHDPGTRPLLTGGDMNALNRARRLQKKIGKINTRFGPKKAKACLPKKRGR